MAVIRYRPRASTRPLVRVVFPEALSPAMPTMIGRSLPAPRRHARWIAICLSGIGSHGRVRGRPQRPPVLGPAGGLPVGANNGRTQRLSRRLERTAPTPAADGPVGLLLR